MPTDTSVNNLVINKLTKAQYNGIATKSETELYLVPDEIDIVPTSGSSNPITSGSVYTALLNKQDIISDLSTIRNGAALGETALQSFSETDPTVPNWAKVFPIVTGDSASNVNNLLFLAPFKGTMGTGSGDVGRFKIGLYTTDGNTPLPADNTLITSIASLNDPGQAWGHATDDTIPTIGLVYNKFSEKADKVNNATNGHLAGLNSNGNLIDSGKAITDLLEFSSDNGVGIVPEDGIKVETVTSAATMNIDPDVVTIIDGAVGTAAITLAVPSDNLAHVWDIFMTTDSSVNITFVMSNSATIKIPSGFTIKTSKSVEISVIGVGSIYYLRYGEFI